MFLKTLDIKGKSRRVAKENLIVTKRIGETL
jgi:hypothetical protein